MPAGRPLRSRLVRAGALVALPYAAVVGWLTANETDLLYVRGPARALAPAPADLRVERVELVAEDGVRLVGWVVPAAGDAAADAPWMLVCHGNAGNISESGRPDHYRALRALGLNVLAFDYRGYGESEGEPTEAGLYRDADAAYRWLREHRGVPPERIYVFGHSLGAAVAIELASRRPVAGVVAEGGFTSLPDIAQEHYPFVPVRWLARSRFESIDRIGSIRAPVLLLHARDDEIVPLAHGRRLHAAAPGSRLVELDGGHNDAFERDSARYFGAIAALVRRG